MKKIFTYVAAFVLMIFLGGTITNKLTGSTSFLNYMPQALQVVPPWYSAAAGGASFLGPLSNAQRTYQMLIHDSLLNGLEGSDIKALTWRLLPSAASNWPAADVNFTNYDIYIGEGIDPSQRHFTFDSNYSTFGVKKRVRFGPLTITAGSFPSGGNPNSFGTD